MRAQKACDQEFAKRGQLWPKTTIFCSKKVTIDPRGEQSDEFQQNTNGGLGARAPAAVDHGGSGSKPPGAGQLGDLVRGASRVMPL